MSAELVTDDSQTRHLAVRISRPADEVYAYAADPANLPHWAAGISTSVDLVDGHWYSESDLGRVEIAFTETNPYGVLDHVVTLPNGESVLNPMRALTDGAACDVVFTVRRRPGMSDTDFERDCAAVAADLDALRELQEQR